MPDRLALAVRVMKAHRQTICPECRHLIQAGQRITRLANPGGWIHVTCVLAVRDYLTAAGVRAEDLAARSPRPDEPALPRRPGDAA